MKNQEAFPIKDGEYILLRYGKRNGKQIARVLIIPFFATPKSRFSVIKWLDGSRRWTKRMLTDLSQYRGKVHDFPEFNARRIRAIAALPEWMRGH